MAKFNICQAIEEAKARASTWKKPNLNLSQKRAAQLIDSILRGSAQVPLGGVQGPPGTGKTSVVEFVAGGSLANIISGGDAWDLVLYVAPTNYLAYQAFVRVTAALLASGYSLKSLLGSMRVYGSKIFAGPCPDKRLEGPARQLVHADIRDDNVRLVFATEFQRVSSKIRAKETPRFHLIVDEASKSPYFRPFITIAKAVISGGAYPATMAVLGDPEQAIAVPEAYRAPGGVPLLIEKVRDSLDQAGYNRNFVLLDTTYRLPRPSEEPISHGFYDGKLRANAPAMAKLKPIAEAFVDYYQQARSILEGLPGSTQLLILNEKLHEAATTDRPIVILDTGKPFQGGSVRTYDKQRTKLAAQAAAVLQVYSMLADNSFSTTVTAPYTDIPVNAAYIFDREYRGAVPGLRPPRAATVHSIIGGEDDVIVAVLGKEYRGRGDDIETIYYMEPGVLNVQYSRHQRLLIVIGHPQKFLSSHAPKRKAAKLRKANERLLDLAKSGYALHYEVGP